MNLDIYIFSIITDSNVLYSIVNTTSKVDKLQLQSAENVNFSIVLGYCSCDDLLESQSFIDNVTVGPLTR